MAALAGRELILGVTGSIAAYKAAYLLRELRRQGAAVTVWPFSGSALTAVHSTFPLLASSA